MELNTLCKFQNIGYCKFKETCFFRHVQNVCKLKTCSRENCLARHPKICKYFLKNKCKFKEKCCFNHKHAEKHLETNEVEEGNKETIALKEDIRKLEEKNEVLESNIKHKTKELEKARVKQLDILEEVKELKRINEELKETIKILQTVIDIYKQAEMDEEQPRDKTDESEHAAKNPEHAGNLEYNCGYCNFKSNSKHGVNVHIGIVHKKQEEDSQLIRF